MSCKGLEHKLNWRPCFKLVLNCYFFVRIFLPEVFRTVKYVDLSLTFYSQTKICFHLVQFGPNYAKQWPIIF